MVYNSLTPSDTVDCGSNDDHKYPAVAFIRDDKEKPLNVQKGCVRKTWRLCHNTYFIVCRRRYNGNFHADEQRKIYKNVSIGQNELDTAAFWDAIMRK